MEIEEVAAHNADVYNLGRGSAQKRKREKAQDQLRNRMRKRNNGTSSSVVSTRSLRTFQRDKGESTVVRGVKAVWDNGKHNFSSEEWRSQGAHYNTLVHPERMVGDKRHRQGEVPLTELVGRVIQRRGHMTTQSSPMTIRALRPPAPPYAIQHPALIRKIQPITKRKPAIGGPYVVVLNRSSSTKKSDPTDSPRDLPPLKQANNSANVEIATWRPELMTTHGPYVHPNAEDRSVTNYRLQMQQAIKIAELRGDFSTSSRPLHKHAPLPAIQVAYEVADKPQVAGNSVGERHVGDRVAENVPVDQQPQSDRVKGVPKESMETINRFTSSQEVLKQMQARKQAKRKKIKVDDFNNPLRTRQRFTTRMKVFKEDLQKARELSIIQEDQSSISDRLSRLSAGRTSVASFRSVGSLKRIEESEVPGYSNRLSQEHALFGVTEASSRESNTDQPSVMDGVEERPGTIMSSDGTNTSESESAAKSDEVVPSLCSDVSVSDKVINDPPDNSAPDPVEQTTEDNADAHEPEASTDHSSNCETCKTLPRVEQNMTSERTDSSDCSSIHDNLKYSDNNDSITDNPITSLDHTTDTTCDSPPNNLTTPHDSNIASNNEEQPHIAIEARPAVNHQSVDSPYEEIDSGRGIAADPFDMKDVILPVETVQ